MKNNKLSLLSRIGLAFLVAITASGCFGPRLEVLSQQLEGTVVKTEGEDDYAYQYRVRVRNKGRAGKVRAIGELHTSEGQFYREQIVSVKPEQDMMLEFIFTEPSLGMDVLAGMSGNTEVRYRFRYESVQ